MNTRELEERLRLEVAQWADRGYAELTQLRYPLAYDNGLSGASPEFCETRVNLLERTAEWVHLTVAVADGEERPGHAISDDFLVYSRGGAEQ
jgi:hypothetical protein